MRHLAGLLIALCLLAVPASAQDAPGAWFEVESFNSGLPELPSRIERRTPQGAVESFLDLTDAEAYEEAAHLLDLTGLPENEQAENGPELARQLRDILDRKALISWRSLLERPDALNANAASSTAMAGEPQRSLLLGVLDLGNREAAIRLNRVKPSDGEPVWVFSQRTVTRIPVLYARYGPSDLEEALPEVLRGPAFWGLHWWEVILTPLVLAVALGAGWLTRRFFAMLARRARGRWSTVALHALRWPSVIAVSMLIIRLVMLNLFVVSNPFAVIIPPLTVIGYIIAFLIFALHVIDAILERLVTFDSEALADPDNNRLRSFATSVSAARRIIIVIGLAVGVGVVLAALDIYRTVGFSLLASAGALTLVIGFAARRVLGNILASLQIAMNRSARIGDQIVFDGAWCTVERIHFTYVQLKKWNSNRIVVPVERFVTEFFVNWSLEDNAMVVPIEITLANTADIPRMRERFAELAGRFDEVEPSDKIKTLVISQDAFGQLVRFQFPAPDPNSAWFLGCQLREEIVASAREFELHAPLPYLPQSRMDELA
ncbi:Small-conductance mechanosensitive channel [Tranquillimonas rosea]|uniref:Small-conductance mechanosensitive channel n=1 Tax=Tranquillimonas rosea TaxID=641238 RepID=A0A1H9TLZ9_9RHOB|nr:mechanosensitive ion channel domain-containing protein [Tranquillimonas rosea]SER98057.1 Small-conductance mechanosensitive channel [Tranquillimonas rosea]